MAVHGNNTHPINDSNPDSSQPYITSTFIYVLEIFSIASTCILCTIGLIVFATVFSAKCREKSASWYLYHLTLVVILDEVVVTPMYVINMLNHDVMCFLIEMTIFTLECFGVFLLNLETLFTIFVPKKSGKRKEKLRFILFSVALWFISASYAVIGIFSVNVDNILKCKNYNFKTELVSRHITIWLACILILVFSVVAIVSFRRKRWQSVQSNNETVTLEGEKREWLNCLLMVNFLTIIANCFTYGSLKFAGDGVLKNASVILWVLISLCKFLIPVSLLFFTNVRHAIASCPVFVCGRFCKCGRASITRPSIEYTREGYEYNSEESPGL